MQPSADYSFAVSQLYKTSFDALSAAGPVDITKKMFTQHELVKKLTLAAARWKIATS